MVKKQYELRYLPLFYEDLLQKTTYISEELHNPKAANDLLDAVEKAIQERSYCAESFEPYSSTRDRELPYYAIYVKNFVVYYVVIDQRIMDVRRFLYKRQDRWGCFRFEYTLSTAAAVSRKNLLSMRRKQGRGYAPSRFIRRP